jgi:hypothetical protein
MMCLCCCPDPELDVHLLQAERWSASSGQFLAGQQLTHVDLVLFTTLSALRSGWVPGAHLVHCLCCNPALLIKITD